MYLIITGISTHTLMWSVTDKTTLKGVVGKDFNSHAHVERDNLWLCCHSYLWNFNSHAHVERDVFTNLDNRTIFISTHTLTWSVTVHVAFCFCWFFISTHTLTWSVTPERCKIGKSDIEFQLTRSRGAWPSRSKQAVQWHSFQLTRSRGAWLVKNFTKIANTPISTHTLTWSVTSKIVFIVGNFSFQLTRSRGAWHKSAYPKFA